MASQVIRDHLSRRLGTIQTNSSGKQTARDDLGRYLGSYCPREDVTRDHLSRRIGSGNLLAALIYQAN